jgi:AraC-like DNA-binding protein
MHAQITPDGCEITHRIPGEPLGLSRHGNELWVMVMLRQMRRATGIRLRPRKVWLAHPPPPESTEVAAALDADDVQFGCGSSGVLISASDLRLPLVTANPAVLQVLDRLSSELVKRDGGRRRLAALVYDAIRDRLDGKVPRIGQVARALALSTRSLQRELSREGATFRDLVDQVRRDLSRDRARDRRAGSIGETAHQLGYSDPSSLSRARARWRS